MHHNANLIIEMLENNSVGREFPDLGQLKIETSDFPGKNKLFIFIIRTSYSIRT